MTRYARNKEFLDQIYYAIGNLYLSRRDTTAAIENYAIAVEKSTRNGIDKALAQLALGNLYFARGEYVKAQPCYSEAVPQLPESYPDYKMLKRRSSVLDELATYAGNVQLQDSLLTLSKMTPEEQRKVAERLAKELIEKEKKEAEDAKREEYLAEQEGKGQDGINKNDASTNSFMLNSDKSWYFYNTMTKTKARRSSSAAGVHVSSKMTGADATRPPSRSIRNRSLTMTHSPLTQSPQTPRLHPNSRRSRRNSSRPKTTRISPNTTSSRFQRPKRRLPRPTMLYRRAFIMKA